jgi:hypothetical protein
VVGAPSVLILLKILSPISQVYPSAMVATDCVLQAGGGATDPKDAAAPKANKLLSTKTFFIPNILRSIFF